MQVVESYLSRVAREAGRLKLPDRLPLAMREFWWEHCADAAVGFDTLFRAVSSCGAGQGPVHRGCLCTVGGARERANQERSSGWARRSGGARLGPAKGSLRSPRHTSVDELC